MPHNQTSRRNRPPQPPNIALLTEESRLVTELVLARRERDMILNHQTQAPGTPNPLIARLYGNLFEQMGTRIARLERELNDLRYRRLHDRLMPTHRAATPAERYAAQTPGNPIFDG